MEGGDREICYTVREDGVITSLTADAWIDFASDNACPGLTPAAVIGRPLEDFVRGEEVRASYRAFHAALLQGLVSEVALTCYCDAPTLRRAHRLLISLARREGQVELCYTSTILSEHPREPVPVLLAPTEGTPGAIGVLLKICSYCKRTRLPPGAPEGQWIPSALYQQEGGSLDVCLSHCICQDCKETFVDPVLRRLRQRRQQGRA